MKDIVAKCQIVGRGISSALRWMEEFASEEKQRASLAKLKKLNREIKKLERATHLKPAVALFGPSQAGYRSDQSSWRKRIYRIGYSIHRGATRGTTGG